LPRESRDQRQISNPERTLPLPFSAWEVSLKDDARETLFSYCERNHRQLSSVLSKKEKEEMEQCQNCKHGEKSHSPNGCGCGCAVFQSPNAPSVFNSIMAGQEIMKKLDTLRQRQKNAS
jgi:hypothetical protein